MKADRTVYPEGLRPPIDQRFFHHAFALFGTAFFCLIAAMQFRSGVLQVSQSFLVISLFVFCVVNIGFTLLFFFQISERIKREYLVLFHMLWGQLSLVLLGYYGISQIHVAMMLSLATFVFVSFGMASVKLGVSVGLVSAGFAWVVTNGMPDQTSDNRIVMLLAYSVSAFFIAFINAYAGNLQMFLEQQNMLIKHRTNQLEKSQEELTLAKEKAEELSQSKTRFLAAASHDLRQPLHALELYVGALPAQRTEEDRNRILRQMEQASTELSQLLSALFDISRFDADVAKVNIQTVNVRDVVEELGFEFRDISAAEGRPLSIRSRDEYVLSDPILMHRVIRGLVSNALKHAKKGRVVLGFRSRGSALRCEVWDSGVGISSDDQVKIFEEFYQVDNSNRDRVQGLGLGLALIKRMCLALNHEFGMRSEPAKGSVFWFEMPKSNSLNHKQNEYPKLNDAHQQTGLKGVKLLCIDDEQRILKGMEELFRNWGCIALCADSYSKAKGMLRMSNVKPEVLVCDYRLPEELNGIDVMLNIREQFNEEIPAVLVTGDLDPSIDDAVNNNNIKVLKKPVNPNVLYQVVADIHRFPGSQVDTQTSKANIEAEH